MLFVPWIIGAAMAGFNPWPSITALLAGALLAYFSVSAVLAYLRQAAARRDRRLLVWAALYGVPGLAVLGPLLYRTPQLIWLAPMVLVTVGVELAYLQWKQERALVNGLASIAGLSMMLPAAALIHRGALIDRDYWAIAAVLTFFWGSLLFVKANLRERQNPLFRLAAVLYHVAVVTGFGLVGGHGPALALALAPALLRTALLRRAKTPALVIGLTEIAATAAFVGLALWALR